MYDLITPDGHITGLSRFASGTILAEVLIENISKNFIGYHIDPQNLLFNLKSTLGQLGVNAYKQDCVFDISRRKAFCKIELLPIGNVAANILELLEEKMFIGRLFAADPSRKVNHSNLVHLLSQFDSQGHPLLSFGSPQDEKLLTSEGITHVPLHEGIIRYEDAIFDFLPSLAKALLKNQTGLREALKHYQKLYPKEPRIVQKEKLLLVKTFPLHVQGVFGKVAEHLLPQGVHHTSACILEPTTTASGDIYELYGSSQGSINTIPLEFYSLNSCP